MESEAAEKLPERAVFPMNLYLMRHANAGVPRDNPVLDDKRGIIKEGKQQCLMMGRMLAAAGVQIDVIVSSPLKRAKQTAQFVATEVGCEAPVLVSKALSPDGEWAAFQELISQYSDREGVLLVGHNPNMSQFLGRLLTGNGPGSGASSVRMRKAGVARVDIGRRPAQLQWLLDPRMMRSIAVMAGKSARALSAKARAAKAKAAKSAQAKAAKTMKPKAGPGKGGKK